MKAKTIVSAVLLLFIAVSIAVLIVRESGDDTSASSELPPGESAAESQLQKDRIAVYYLHGNVRCQTCNTLEEYSHEAVTNLFADGLESGLIEWQVINYDETWNEHFLTDYDLSFQSLVLVEMKEGKEVLHSNLDKIWDLVGDKPAYMEYVQKEIDSRLGAL